MKLKKRIKELQELIAIQCSDGNWNYDPYMYGFANGMLLSLAVLTHKKAEYLKHPKVWLRDTTKSEGSIAKERADETNE